MGRRDRERKERILSGEEAPMSEQRLEEARKTLSNPLTRMVARRKARGGVVDELSKGSVNDQTGRLTELVGTGGLPAGSLKKALMNNAPKEMDRAIKKFRNQGKEITVDSLLAEARSNPSFINMCEQVGLSMEWFENLARQRMEAHGL